MKTLDYIVLAIFVVGLILLCFFRSCPLDVCFLVFGFAIALMSLVTMIWQARSNPKDRTV